LALSLRRLIDGRITTREGKEMINDDRRETIWDVLNIQTNDRVVLDGETRVSESALAKSLGMSAAEMRQLIENNRAELEQHGPLISVTGIVGDSDK
jgi:hypothetical protein